MQPALSATVLTAKSLLLVRLRKFIKAQCTAYVALMANSGLYRLGVEGCSMLWHPGLPSLLGRAAG